MNKLNIQQTGGFPLTTNTLDFMQASLLLMQNFGEIAGDLTIISGCDVSGTQVSPGMMYIDGELIPFLGGTLSTNVVIRENRTQKQFENGVARDVEIDRSAAFGNGLKSYPWADFTRIKPLKILQKALTPVGLISMWGGSVDNIPEGWHLCNGENGTPDLRGKFIRGFSEDEHRQDENAGINCTGGKDKITLQEVNMPPHSHTGSTDNDGTHTHKLKDGTGGHDTNSIRGDRNNSPNLTGQDYGTQWVEDLRLVSGGAHKHNFKTNKAGGLNGHAQAFDNRPSFYILAFIIYKS